MDYLCAYDWQQAEDCVCLVLKQLEFPGKISVVLGCMSYNRTFVKKMTDWFYERGLSICHRSDGEVEAMERGLWQELSELGNENGGMIFWGASDNFVLGRSASIKEEKKIRVGILNDRFGKPHYRELLPQKQEKIMIVSGRLEPGVGLLMATEDFFQNLSKEQIQTCLDVKVLNKEIKLQKRLVELTQEAERKGGKHPAGMLIVTCQEK